jgi:hypothetical protein
MRADVGKTKYARIANDLTFVHGACSSPLGRVKLAYSAGSLKGRTLIVYPKFKDGGTKSDVDNLMVTLRSKFPGIPELHLADFPPPPVIKSKKGVKIIPPLPSEMVHFSGTMVDISTVITRVYVTLKIRSSWGSRRARWALGENRVLDNSQRREVMANIITLNSEFPSMKISSPVEVTAASMHFLKLRHRKEWVPLSLHVADKLTNQANIDELGKLISGVKYSVDLTYRHHDSTGFLDNMVYLKSKHADVFEVVKGKLKDHGILDDIEGCFRYSSSSKAKKDNVEPAALTAYRDLASAFDIPIQTPAFSKITQNLNDKYKDASAVHYSTWLTLYAHAPEVLPVFLDNLLKRGY